MMQENFKEICRICWGELDLLSIFNLQEDITLADMIADLTNIIITKNDGLPENICNECFINVKIGYKVKQKFEESNEILRQILENKMNESADVVNELHVNNITNNNPYDITKMLNHHNGYNTVDPLKAENYLLTDNYLKISKIEKHNKTIICHICGKDFLCHAELLQHHRSHTVESPFICNTCNKKFTQKSNLHLHERVHLNEKRFVCEICSKQFTNNSNLMQHMLSHSTERKFSCDQCEKSFKTAIGLKNHMGTHSGVKNFSCGKCGKGFYKANYLTVHMRAVHLGIKNHSCSECGKEFYSTSNLRAHFRIHTGQKPYECNVCHMCFNQSSSLARHKQQQHKSDIINNVYHKI